jgi:hypothetical protein
LADFSSAAIPTIRNPSKERAQISAIDDYPYRSEGISIKRPDIPDRLTQDSVPAFDRGLSPEAPGSRDFIKGRVSGGIGQAAGLDSGRSGGIELND